MEEHKSQEFKNRSRSYFEKLSSHYSGSHISQYTAPMHDYLISELDKIDFGTLLDIGCGTGIFLLKVLKKFEAKMAGIDISPGMIEKSKELLGDRAELKVGDSEHLPWNDGYFDVVTCIASFHHYPNPEIVLKEIRRVLRHGGTVMIADPWAPGPWRSLANLIARTPFSKDGDVKVYSEREMRIMLEVSGYKSINWKVKGNRWKKYFIVSALAG